MFIVWGSTGKEIEIGRGQFHCPACGGRRAYRHVRAARYFTLYFIPLWETENLGQYIKCETCQNAFHEAALSGNGHGGRGTKRRGGKKGKNKASAKRGQESEDLLTSTREELELGTSVQETKQLLLDMHVDGVVADKLIAAATGGRTRECAECRLRFLDQVAACTACGRTL
jgi:hypothetical protein